MREPDRGRLGALGEGSLAMCSVLAATTGGVAPRAEVGHLYSDFSTASDDAAGDFVNGVAVFANNLGIPLDLAVIFAAMVVICAAALLGTCSAVTALRRGR